MKYYLADYENVNTHGLNGLENISIEDTVCIFYSEFANSISIDHHFAIEKSKANIFFQKVLITPKDNTVQKPKTQTQKNINEREEKFCSVFDAHFKTKQNSRWK